MGFGAPGGGGDAVAAPGQQRHGDRADPAGGPGNQHFAAIGGDGAPGFERIDAQRRRIAGGADGHGLLKRKLGRQAGQPLRLDALVAGIAAPFGFRQAPAIDDHPVAGVPIGRARLKDGAGQVGPGHHGQLARDAALARDGQPVLVVEAGIGDLDQDFVVGQIAQGELAEGGARLALDIFDHQGGEGLDHAEGLMLAGPVETAGKCWRMNGAPVNASLPQCREPKICAGAAGSSGNAPTTWGLPI